MTTTTTVYGVLIQTAPRAKYQAYAGWDLPMASRHEADALAARARKIWHAAKVIHMTHAEAIRLGWVREEAR